VTNIEINPTIPSAHVSPFFELDPKWRDGRDSNPCLAGILCPGVRRDTDLVAFQWLFFRDLPDLRIHLPA